MQIPARLPGLRPATFVLVVLFLIWIPFEGALWRVTLMGALVSLVGLLWLAQRLLGGRRLPLPVWLFTLTGGGAILGVGVPIVVVLLMAVKTGLHGHGPEFTASEIAWVRQQLPLWFTGGTLAGLGMGLISAGLSASPLPPGGEG